MSLRIEKINDLIRAQLGIILQREFGPEFGLISINRVETSPDLENCRINISIFSGTADPVEAVAQLNRRQGKIRTLLAHSIKLKHTPRLNFVYDDSLAHAQKIEKILKDLKQ